MSSVSSPNQQFDGDDTRFKSQRSDTFSDFNADSVNDPSGDSSPVTGTHHSYTQQESAFSSPIELEPEEGFALREWRRQNAIELEEKERKEKEMRRQIIEEAEEYKVEFYRKRQLNVENKKASNREKEKSFLESHQKFQAEAENNYWKAIGELIPKEVPAIEKRGKKDKEKKPSIVVIHGPKPGKPTDLSRMRHILLKLKHNPPSHMKPKPPQSSEPKKGADMQPSNGVSTSTAPPKPPAVSAV